MATVHHQITAPGETLVDVRTRLRLIATSDGVGFGYVGMRGIGGDRWENPDDDGLVVFTDVDPNLTADGAGPHPDMAPEGALYGLTVYVMDDGFPVELGPEIAFDVWDIEDVQWVAIRQTDPPDTIEPSGLSIVRQDVAALDVRVDELEGGAAGGLSAHLADPDGAHAASAISVDPTGLAYFSSTDVQGIVGELDASVDGLNNTVTSAVEAEAAIRGNADAVLQGAIEDHVADPTGAHAASAVSIDDAPMQIISGPDLQGALEIIDSAIAAEASQREGADAAHAAETTGVHGIADTSELLTTSSVLNDAQIPSAIARDAEVTAAISAAVNALVASAPGLLDTLDEIAAALGDDPAFATTITALIATKISASLFDANTVLVANTDNNPAALTVGEATMLGRLTGGNIAALTPAQIRTLAGLVIGTNVQAFHANLSALAGLTGAADTFAYFTGAGTMATGSVTALARFLLASADQATMQTVLALVPNTNVMAVGAAPGPSWNLTPTVMNKWRKAHAKFRAGTSDLRILFLGDSTTMGTGATLYTGTLPMQVQAMLASRLSADTTQGFIFADQGTSTPTDPRYTLNASGTGWTVTTQWVLGQGWFNAPSAATGVLRFTPPQAFDTIRVLYFKNTGHGTSTINVDGGASLGNIVGSGSPSMNFATFTVAAGTHQINISGPTGGQIFIAGVEVSMSTTKRVMVTNGGRGGYQSVSLTSATNSYDMQNAILQVNPDLTVISIGINDATAAVSQATYTSRLTTAIGFAQATGSVILVPPYPSNGANWTLEQQYATAMKSLAVSLGCGFVDLHSRVTDYTTANALGLMFDTLHPNELGYSDMAAGVAQAILAAA